MSLPALSHLQCLIIYLISGKETSGAQLRNKLAEHGARKSGPSFYQIMARLEDSGYVKGHYKSRVIDGQHVKERRYRTTANGRSAMADAFEFWRKLV